MELPRTGAGTRAPLPTDVSAEVEHQAPSDTARFQQAVRFGTESLLLTHMALLGLMIAVVPCTLPFPKMPCRPRAGESGPTPYCTF